ncbi:MAG: hypothetical protein QXG39_06295 [Candidatus Aenigmatarchaeota archaeon]
MSEVKVKTVKKVSEIPPEEKSAEKLEEREFENLTGEPEIEEYAEVIEATEREDKAKIIFETDRKTAKKLTELCDILDISKREFIEEAIKSHIAKLEDLSFLDNFNLSDYYVRVDDFIAYLKAQKITVLMPKALKKIRENLEPKPAITLGVNKWVEFCRKMGLDIEEASNPTHAFYIKWK